MLQQDLENLPQFLCRQDDVVLVERSPSAGFLTILKQSGYALPDQAALAENAWQKLVGDDSEALARAAGDFSLDARLEISQARIEASVKRVLTLKINMGLLPIPHPSSQATPASHSPTPTNTPKKNAK
jgi:beta-glucosidase-like glycosyl hydrolase